VTAEPVRQLRHWRSGWWRTSGCESGTPTICFGVALLEHLCHDSDCLCSNSVDSRKKHYALLVDRTGAPRSSPAHSGSAAQASLSRRPPTSSPPARHSHRLHGLLREQILASGAVPRDKGRSIFELKRRVLLHYGCNCLFYTHKPRAMAHPSPSLNQLVL